MMSLHNSSISFTGSGSMKNRETTSKSVKAMTKELPKYRNYLTFSLYISFMALGMTAGLGGPTFLHMTYILNTDIETLAVTHTFGSIGYLSGSLLCGILFDKFNAELQFALVTFLMGVAVIFSPWAPVVYIYYMANFVQCLSMGYLDTSGQGYVIGLWNDHSFKEPIMQGMHGIWSVGATICPFIIVPFLSELPTDGTVDDVVSNATTESNVTEENVVDVASVRYCFAIVGGIIVAMSICFFTAFFMIGPSCLKIKKAKKSKLDNEGNKEKKRGNQKKWLVIIILVLEFFFYAFYAWYEIIPGSYLSVFVIKGLEWDVTYGPIITSVYWGFHGLGRIAAIPISYFISPGKMVATNLLFTFIGFAMMVMTPITNDFILWFSTGLAGFAMASTFASLILWTSNYIEITGSVGACFLAGSSFGSMIGGTLTGYLFQRHSHMWVAILSLLGCIFDIALFILIVCLAKSFFKDHKKETLHSNDAVELEPMKAIEIDT